MVSLQDYDIFMTLTGKELGIGRDIKDGKRYFNGNITSIKTEANLKTKAMIYALKCKKYIHL